MGVLTGDGADLDGVNEAIVESGDSGIVTLAGYKNLQTVMNYLGSFEDEAKQVENLLQSKKGSLGKEGVEG